MGYNLVNRDPNTAPFSFDLHARQGSARAGMFHTLHGDLPTPVFAPVGTQANVKALTPAQLQEIGASLVLANTYHLYLRPGDPLVAEMGGLHRFMGWPGPILTDSGGFQVFSLAENRKVDADGVTFRSHIDGSTHRLTPEKSIAIQENLGADIIMAFDECAPPYDLEYNQIAMNRTHAWAERCSQAKTRSDQALFGIVQGGIHLDLRRQSAECIAALDFPSRAQLEAQGLPAFRDQVGRLAPFMVDRVGELQSWEPIKLLTVQVDRLRDWCRPGLLCIGDAAHAMSPIGGVGINLAIHDAVAAANLLADPLRRGVVTLKDLRLVQDRRAWPTHMTQRKQLFLQDRVIKSLLAGEGPLVPPWPLRLIARFPFLRRIPARLVGMGFGPEHVRPKG